MTTTETSTTTQTSDLTVITHPELDIPADPTTALVNRLFEAGIGSFELISVALGNALGLYQALAAGPATSSELACRAGIHERYAREWLEQQSIAELLAVDDPAKPAAERAYTLPDFAIPVLLDPLSPAYLAPMGAFLVAIGPIWNQLLRAYRTGGGVPWSEYSEAITAQAAVNRPFFTDGLGDAIATAAPDIDARLREHGGAVADIACGAGWSTLAMARRYPAARIEGYDADNESISVALENLAGSGITSAVTFTVSAMESPVDDRYDLITILEALHDMSHPVEVLRTALVSLHPDGAVIVMDEKVAPAFGAIGDPMERFFYAASLLCCLPNGMVDEGSAATGTMMRESTLREYATAAGFGYVHVADVEHDMFRFYVLRR